MHKTTPPNKRLKQHSRLRTSLNTKMRTLVVAGSLMLLIGGSIGTYLMVGTPDETKAAAVGDYRSATTGNWGTAATWEMYNGVSWTPALSAPTSASGTITIQNGHTVTVMANTTADQVVVEEGGTLNISSGTLSLANGTGNDLINNGIVNTNSGGTLSIASGALVEIAGGGTHNNNGGSQTLTGWAIRDGGTYVHNVNNVNLPTATWSANSTLKVTGVTTSNLKGMNQDFGNFIYDCAGQTGNIEFWESIGSIQGNFIVNNTGTGGTWIQRTSTTTPLNVSGYYLQTGGLIYGTKGAAFTWNIYGTFTLNGGTFVEVERYGLPVMNIYGVFTINSGTFNHSTYNTNLPNEGIGVVNLYNNYLRTGGLHTETATLTGRGDFNFAKTGVQTFVHTGGTITNTVNFTVNSGSILDLATYMVTGDGSFTLSDGGGLIMASPNGITASGATGNVQVTGARNFSTNGDYTYNATTAQVTGSGLPATVHNITFDNANDVTLTGSTSATNLVTLTNGRVITNANELGVTNTASASVVNYSNTRYVVGFLRRSVAATGTYDFPVGTMAQYELASLAFSGMSGFTSILSSFTNANPIDPSYPLTGLTINGTPIEDVLNYGYWTLTPESAMSGGTYTVTLNERGHTNSATNPNEYGVIKREDVNAYWTSQGTHSNSTQFETGGTATASRSALSAFSHFAIGKGGGPLPVSLIRFDAKPSDQGVYCSWKTASEVNNDYFTLERSGNGVTFTEVARVDGSGNSSTAHEYSYTDMKPLNGTSYYRLRQTDYDGHQTVFPMVKVRVDGNQQNPGGITIRPNPVTDNFKIAFQSDASGTAVATICTTNGVVIFSQQVEFIEGSNEIGFDFPRQARGGMYLFKLEHPALKFAPVRLVKN
ncbi:MAG TPA: hypothetical protein VFW78_10585 [Bacteroidia bacterium]|nr:hypothetical protein [Bacteroidia bacterium]